MKPRRVVIVTMLFLATLVAAGFVKNRFIVMVTEQRISHFISAHYVAGRETISDAPSGSPGSITGILESRNGSKSALFSPFPDGLVFKRNGDGFTLSEPSPRPVSLFRSDYLVGSDEEWPHWHGSGELVWKFPDQEIPAGYLNTPGTNKE